MVDYVVNGGQTSSAVIVDAGDTLSVLAGGTAVSTTISSGGLETVSSGGRDLNATIGPALPNGGAEARQIIEAGGVASGDTVGFGLQEVFGTVSASTVSFGTLDVGFGGSAVATQVTSGLYNVFGGGSASGTIIEKAGWGVVFSGGIEQNVTVRPGGRFDVASGGTLLGGAVSAGILFDVGIMSGVVLSSATQATILRASDITPLAVNTVVLAGATLAVVGTVSATLVSGGTELLGSPGFSPGNDIGATVVGGGNLVVSSGGVTSGTVILAGGRLTNAGFVGGAILTSGGTLDNRGSVSGIVVGSGASGFGQDFDGVVSAGGNISNVIIDSGRVLDLKPGANVGGGIVVASGGRLVLEDTASANFLISTAPGGVIDLPNLSFSSSGTVVVQSDSNRGNILHIVENGGTADLRIAQVQGQTLSVGADASGGTLVTAVPAGQLGFLGGGFTSTHIDLNGTTAAIPGAFNVEVFTLSAVSPLPPLASGYDVGILAIGAALDSGFLRGAVQLFAGDYEVLDTATTIGAGGAIVVPKPTLIKLGSGNQTVVGAAADTVSAGSGDQVINGLAGHMLISGGYGGPANGITVFGGIGDTVVGGSTDFVDANVGGMTVYVGGRGTDTIFAANGSTVYGGDGASLINLGSGGVANFNVLNGGVLGATTINATAGASLVTLGVGDATVFGGAGDTINGQIYPSGSNTQYIDAQPGGIFVHVGENANGVETVFGSTVAGSGDTIIGGRATLIYSGGTGDLIDWTGAFGNAVINAISTADAPPNDTIIAGTGFMSVWGGAGDRIAVGPATAGRSLWGHSTTVLDAVIGFGTNNTASATSYDTIGGTASVNPTVPGVSHAQVTIGGAAGNFDTLRDYLFYPNETVATNAAIIATAQSADGTATLLTLPDGTGMTLVGVTQPQLAAALLAGTLFKP